MSEPDDEQRKEPIRTLAWYESAGVATRSVQSVRYSIEFAAYLTQVSRRSIVLYYKHGLIAPVSDPERSGWYFDEEAIRMIRQIEILREGYGVNLAGLKLLLGLRSEVERLQAQVRFLRRV
jgi:MerR family transcriptional regulator/heat shock protein HspR